MVARSLRQESKIDFEKHVPTREHSFREPDLVSHTGYRNESRITMIVWCLNASSKSLSTDLYRSSNDSPMRHLVRHLQRNVDP